MNGTHARQNSLIITRLLCSAQSLRSQTSKTICILVRVVWAYVWRCGLIVVGGVSCGCGTS